MSAPRHYVLLPGLNGTAHLATELQATTPTSARLTVLALPADHPRTYDELAEWALPRMPSEPFTLIAESFSGPLGVLVASRTPTVAALVLCATFVSPAAPALLASVPRLLLERRPPRAVLRALLTGGNVHLADRVHESLRDVPPAVLASRIVQTLRVDARAALAAYDGPLLYLQATRDRLVLGHHARQIAKLAPRLRVARLDAPHLVLQTRAEEAWTHMLELGQ